MSFIKQISKAIKKQKRCHSHSRVATHFLFVLSLAVIAIGGLVYDATQTQLAEAQTNEWYGGGGTWPYRQKLTIDHTKVVVAGSLYLPLDNFPILISITSDNLKDISNGGHVSQSDGGDIVFAPEGYPTYKLDHEIEKYDPTTGELIAWVKHNVFADHDVAIYMYYGNELADDQWNPEAVWDMNFKMVQHMHATGATFEDSTSFSNDGVPSNVIQGVEGKIGQAASFSGNVNSLIDLGPSSNLTGDNLQTATMSAWIKFNSTVSQYPFAIKRTATPLGDSSLISLNVNNGGAGKVGFVTRNSSDQHTFLMSTETNFNDGEWHKLEAVITSASDRILYVDGIELKRDTQGMQLSLGTTYSAFIGAFNASQLLFNGQIDEVTFSKIARGADWIQTSYNNQSDPNAFISMGSDVEEVYAMDSLTITSPTTGTNWKIGDTETITFSIGDIDDTIDHFQIYYSEDNGSNWNLIDDNVSASVTNYDWENIPIVSDPGESDCKIKVEAHDSASTLLATKESDAFTIDYGPVADWNLEMLMDDRPLRGKIAIETSFTLKATAKDQHGNTITNYQGEIGLLFSTASSPNSPFITPSNLGGVGIGSWEEGSISYSDYKISIDDNSVLPLSSIQIKTSAPEDSTESFTLSKYGIFIVDPNSDSHWTIGGAKNISFKFTGLAPVVPGESFARFSYSQTNWTTPSSPVKDAVDNDLRVDYVAGQQLVDIEGYFPYALDGPIQIKAEFCDNDNETPADPSDDLVLADDISEQFAMGNVAALQGTYVSAKFDISATPDADTFLNFSDVNGFSATYTEQADFSDVEFSLRFFNSSSVLLGTAGHPEGWYVLDDEDFEGSLAILNTYNWLDEIKQIQFRIYMETENYDVYSPSVEFLQLNYEIDTGAQVGTINFESGNNTQSVARGSSVDFGVRINVASGYEDQISEIVLHGEAIDATITIDPVIITGTGETIYTANVNFETTSLTPLGDHAISIDAEVTGHPEMTFTPNLLTGTLQVTDSTAEDFSLTWDGTTPDINKTVQPGGIASYNFIAEWDDNYTYDIILTTNITTVIGTSYIDKVEYYVGSDLVTGNTLVKPLVVPYTKTVQMRVTTKLSGGEKSLTSFTITGTGNSIPKTLTPSPSLTISNQPVDKVTIDAKAEVEGGVATGFLAPTFTVRLYKKGTTTYTEQTGVLATSKETATDKYLIKATFDKSTTDANGKIVAGTTYVGYLRSIRHFWKKATTPTGGEIAIVAGTNSYTLEFPKLLAGDISPDNEVNSFDFTAAIQNFTQNLPNALNDFNNDGQINTLDLFFVFTNYFKKGDLLP